MSFKSEAQRRFLHKNYPDIAKRWEKEAATGVLPDRIHPKKQNQSAYSNKKPMRNIRKIFRGN
jgi:hypothetical protein